MQFSWYFELHQISGYSWNLLEAEPIGIGYSCIRRVDVARLASFYSSSWFNLMFRRQWVGYIHIVLYTEAKKHNFMSIRTSQASHVKHKAQIPKSNWFVSEPQCHTQRMLQAGASRYAYSACFSSAIDSICIDLVVTHQLVRCVLGTMSALLTLDWQKAVIHCWFTWEGGSELSFCWTHDACCRSFEMTLNMPNKTLTIPLFASP